MKKTSGMLLGKFMPLHLGHLYLIEFAKNYVDELYVVVGTIKSETMEGDLRYNWVRQACPGVNVIHLTDENPQEPQEHPDFWQIWYNSLTQVLPNKPDYVFASEKYGQKLAAILHAQFVPVDQLRTIVPISATKIRNDPMKYWQYIPRPVRPYYCKRVCIFGPESTGKSTLALDLAHHFNTVAVPEYARTHLEAGEGKIDYSDIAKIARGQMASEEALAHNSNRVIFCDTDLVLTTIWSDWLFQDCPDWVLEQANERKYDLYLVTDIDVPWVKDQVRYLPKERESFFKRCLAELDQRDLPYVVIKGDWEKRFEMAIAEVEKLFA